MRVGKHSLSLGERRIIALPLPGRAEAADAIPVWVAVGREPGPRVTVVAAARGFESAAAASAAALVDRLDVAAMTGSVTIVPVLRPGGRFAARGQPIAESAAWQFPGDPGGNRRAREAFAIFSELVVGSSLVVLVTQPEPGRLAVPMVRADLDDVRLRRLALVTGARVAVHARPPAGSLGAAAREMGIGMLEVILGGGDAVPGTKAGSVGEARPAPAGVALLQALLVQAGIIRAAAPAPAAEPPLTVTETAVVRAPTGGLVDAEAMPGCLVERGKVLARVMPPLGHRPSEIKARHDVVVLEATGRGGVRSRAPLFLVGRISRAALSRAAKAAARRRREHGAEESHSRNGAERNGVEQSVAVNRAHHVAPANGGDGAGILRIGWVESVSLPALGVVRMRAKIDTGARTSALHVTSMKVVGTTDGLHRRPILELTVPAGGRRAGVRPAPVRVQVRDYVLVKDTSGHTERRPVIETTLRLGTIHRRIRVTLTNRGDMLFPMLIGRTALGPDVLVDPSRRSLVRPRP